ncbi:ATP-binding protein [Thermosulfurimonas dismutans]|uniref:histidine kinase n=1 Tax=Thermosulfurimonas dismutans TaxID=999894 RepID=A0A179D2Q6_9BACT|nr:ATP-binding protein [Thermosulfurimonas dismutans]OAQ20360.1 Signal transduction histidine kinase [Thermosulfurimonas dismutans]
MASRRYLFLFFTVLLALGLGFLYDFYRLKKEWEKFFYLTLEEEKRRIYSVLKATVISGGDPVETLAEYMEDSDLLKGAALILSGRTIIVPGTDIPPKNLIYTLELNPFVFKLYFSGEVFYEIKRHFYIELSLWLLLNFMGLGLTLWLLRSYYESRLILAQERAEAERLKSVSLAIASMLHEVKNALNNLNFAVFRLKKKTSSEEIKILEEEIRRLTLYLVEVSDLRKPLALRPVETRINDLIKEILGEFSERVEDLGVETEVRLAPAKLSVDPEKMRVVLRNLIRNALEALAQAPPPRRMRLYGDVEGEFYRIEVADSAGLLPETTELFRPYKSQKPGGFGLGLFNVKRIVEAHGGSVKAELCSGWTVFTIRLPLGNFSEK